MSNSLSSAAHPLVDQLVQICAERGVRQWILAPGSRSAPLTVALTRHPQMCCRLIFDERSAAYVALGLAQQLVAPVGLVCTSGTAAVNFAPAVVEAFYQGVPLLVLTADRPPEWIDQQDNQAIHQNGLFAPHVRGSFTLPLEDGAPDTSWFVSRIVANAIDLAQGWEPGPVHINVPLREPLYSEPAGQPAPAITSIRTLSSQPQLTEDAWELLLRQWRQADRKLIVAGMQRSDAGLQASLSQLAAQSNVAIFADATANLYSLASVSGHADAALGTRDPTTLRRLQPELVVNFGGQVTSKNIKTLLRSHPPQTLWHVRPSLVAPDTYQALTHVIPMQPAQFFRQLTDRLVQDTTNALAGNDSSYQADWHGLNAQAADVLAQFLNNVPFGEFSAVHQLLAALPPHSLLQIGNSMPIRYVNILGMQPGHHPARVNGNRGVSGIDGTVSTAVGAALSTTVLTTLIVGDLGFFYDRNGLWHSHLPPNLRIVLLNNHGGGIFDIIDGPNRLERERQETYFLTPQPLTARRTAEDHGLHYLHAAGNTDLTRQLADFFALDAGPSLLEIETDMATNTAIYGRFKAAVAGLRLA